MIVCDTGPLLAVANSDDSEHAAAEEIEVESLTPGDFGRMADLVVQYGSFPLGAADASVIAVAERLGARTVATLDHRHFRQVTPRHGALTVIPGEHELARHRR